LAETGIAAGRLNKWVKFQRRAAGEDDFGNPDGRWRDIAKSRAEVWPLVGREYFAAQQVQAETTYRITVRYVPSLRNLKTNDRVIYGEKVLDIQSVMNVGENNVVLQVMCIERRA